LLAVKEPIDCLTKLAMNYQELGHKLSKRASTSNYSTALHPSIISSLGSQTINYLDFLIFILLDSCWKSTLFLGFHKRINNRYCF